MYVLVTSKKDTKLRYLTILALMSIVFVSCKPRSDAENSNTGAVVQEEFSYLSKIEPGCDAVCIWDQTVVRSEPSREKGRWLAALSLGETVVWLGESAVDSSDQNLEYHKIQLSDGKVGWALAYSLVRGAKSGAITQRAYIHQRPDLLTVTDAIFEPMDMVAISRIEGDWYEAIGNQRKKSGWIHKGGVSFAQADVAAAILATKAFRESNPEKRQQMLSIIVENPALSNSVFLAGIRAMLSPSPMLDKAPNDFEPAIGGGGSDESYEQWQFD